MPNIIVLVIVFILGYAVLHTSADKDAQKTREQLAKTPNAEPVMVQGEASGGAWLLVIVLLVVGLAAAFH